VSDWKETIDDEEWAELGGDRWGPTHVAVEGRSARYPKEAFVPPDADVYGEGIATRGSVAPWSVVRALLRAHDLRTKAPGTECKRCPGLCVGEDMISVPDHLRCRSCHGSGLGLTPAELERWKGWAK
jgi:hypothetical protein